MGVDRARLLVHEDPLGGSLLLIHEVEQPSYLLLWEIFTTEFVTCGIVASNTLQIGQSSAKTISVLTAIGGQTLLGKNIESKTGTLVDPEASPTVFGTVIGGRC